jgi:hypothetical protein
MDVGEGGNMRNPVRSRVRSPHSTIYEPSEAGPQGEAVADAVDCGIYRGEACREAGDVTGAVMSGCAGPYPSGHVSRVARGFVRGTLTGTAWHGTGAARPGTARAKTGDTASAVTGLVPGRFTRGLTPGWAGGVS